MALLLVLWQIYIICTTNYFYLIKIHKKRLLISIVLSYRFCALLAATRRASYRCMPPQPVTSIMSKANVINMITCVLPIINEVLLLPQGDALQDDDDGTLVVEECHLVVIDAFAGFGALQR